MTTPASGPVPAFDPIAAALPEVDAALRRAAQGPAHPAPFITATEGRATGDAQSGWTVTWSRHPPAGWAIEAVATVSATGQVKVTKAEATFASD